MRVLKQECERGTDIIYQNTSMGTYAKIYHSCYFFNNIDTEPYITAYNKAEKIFSWNKLLNDSTSQNENSFEITSYELCCVQRICEAVTKINLKLQREERINTENSKTHTLKHLNRTI